MSRVRPMLEMTLLVVLYGVVSTPLWGQMEVSPEGVVTAVFQNGTVYASATDTDTGTALKATVNTKDGFSLGRLIRFGNLGEWIRGDGIEILDAKLQLHYVDEWWTLAVYHVAVSRSLDGSITRIADEPECTVKIFGDKWPANQKTPRPSWVDFSLKPETVKAWIADEKQNTGLVIHTTHIETGGSGKAEPLKLVGEGKGALGPVFRSCRSKDEPPRLVVRYRITGNAAPTSPLLAGVRPLWGIYREADLALTPSRDFDGDAISYEIETARGAAPKDLQWRRASAEVSGDRIRWRFGEDWDALAAAAPVQPGEGLWLRVRAVDAKGAQSRWEAVGPYGKAERSVTVWGTHGNRKIWPDLKPVSAHAEVVKIQCARNEWEPFQVIVMSHGGLANMKISASALTDGKGHTVPAPTVYRQHYLPIADTANKRDGHVGPVPDALVPLVHPITGEPTGGLYGGAVFNIPAGAFGAFWFDIRVTTDTPAGTYTGSATVTADGIAAVTIPVELKVHDFVLPRVKHLNGYFQMNGNGTGAYHQFFKRFKDPEDIKKRKDALARMYDEMLHDHYISTWSPVWGWNYTLNGLKVNVSADRKVTLDWTEYDALVTPYMDGTAYKDGVPSQCLMVPYWLPVLKKDSTEMAPRVNMHNYQNIQKDLFAQFIRQVEQHFVEKGWIDRSFFFYFDEPFLQAWKYGAFVETARIVRNEAPRMRIMITDGYKGEEAYRKIQHIDEPITKYVDVWDPVTFQVRADTIDFYRQRKREGKFDIWCQTLGNANANSPLPNLYPEYDMPFHRTWAHMSWNFGFQGLEWWETVVARGGGWTDPIAFPPFNKPLNCDGRLFYPGTPEAIGGPDIPISCLRMKALREAIEDYEYFYMLEKLGHTEQEFDINCLSTVIPDKVKLMTKPMALGKDEASKWQWWEGDPDAQLKARQKVAELIEAKQKR